MRKQGSTTDKTKSEKFIQQFADYIRVERGLAVNTIKSYSRDLVDFALFIENWSLDSVLEATRLDVARYLAHLHQRELSSSTIDRKTDAIKSFYRFLKAERYITDDPTRLIESPRSWSKTPIVLSIEEVQSLLVEPETYNPRGLRNNMIS